MLRPRSRRMPERLRSSRRRRHATRRLEVVCRRSRRHSVITLLPKQAPVSGRHVDADTAVTPGIVERRSRIAWCAATAAAPARVPDDRATRRETSAPTPGRSRDRRCAVSESCGASARTRPPARGPALPGLPSTGDARENERGSPCCRVRSRAATPGAARRAAAESRRTRRRPAGSTRT